MGKVGDMTLKGGSDTTREIEHGYAHMRPHSPSNIHLSPG